MIDYSTNRLRGVIAASDHRHIDAVVLFAFALVVIGTVVRVGFDVLPTADSMQYAVVARELLRGNGFTTKIIPTVSLTFSGSYVGHPSLMRPPLYPALVAVGQAVFGARGVASMAVNAVAFSAIAPTLYLLGRELYDRRTAVIAGVLATLTVAPVSYVLAGATEPVYILVFLATVLLALRGRTLGVGVLIGVAYLARYNTLFLAPGLLALVYLAGDGDPRERTRRVAAAAGVAALVVAPWLLRNVAVVGRPFVSLQQYEVVMFTGTYPGRLPYHSLDPPSPMGFALSNPGELVVKFVSGMQTLYFGVPDLVVNWVYLPLAAVGVYESRSRETRTLTIGLGIVILFQFVVLAVASAHAEVRLFAPLLPVLILFASKGIVDVAGRVSTPRASPRLVTVAVVAFVLFPNLVGVAMVATAESPSYLDEEAEALAHIEAEVPEDAVVVTDVPWAVAWHSDRVAVLTPADPDVLTGQLSDVDYVYMGTAGRPSTPVNDGRHRDRLLESQVVTEEFEVVEEFDSGSVLLERRGRNDEAVDRRIAPGLPDPGGSSE